MDPAKDFDAIADDYTFFETHATEAAHDARAYVSRLKSVLTAGQKIRLLDFGCGTGTFTSRLIHTAGWQPGSIELTLVEPADEARRAAVNRLTELSSEPIRESAQLPTVITEKYDVVLANHVFYYVPELLSILHQLVNVVAPSGVFMTAIAGRANPLIQFWLAAFQLINQPAPYHTSEDVESALTRLNVPYQKEQAPYELVLADSRENRMRLIRFLLANHLAAMPQEKLLAFFDQFAHAGHIEIQTASDHYTIRNYSPAREDSAAMNSR